MGQYVILLQIAEKNKPKKQDKLIVVNFPH